MPPSSPGHQVSLWSASVPANSRAPTPIPMPASAAPYGLGLERFGAHAPLQDGEDEQRDDEGEEPARPLEEREVGAVEVDQGVGGGQRARDEAGQEGPDAGRGAESGAGEDVEEGVHARLGF